MTEQACPKCKTGKLIERNGKFGPFLACNKYSCKYTRSLQSKVVESKELLKLQGSEQQENIWAQVKNGVKHLIVKALAGCGKTTTLVQILNHADMNLRIAFVAFNRHIVAELKDRIGNRATIGTMHSLCFNAIRNHFGNVFVDEYKVAKILEEMSINDNLSYAIPLIEQLVALVKMNLCADDNDTLDQLALHYGIDIDEDDRRAVYKIVRSVLLKSKNSKKVIDFNDMLWFVIAHNIPVETYDLLCVDEAQDYNKLQQAIAMLMIGKNGRMVVVGDENQAIYGFAGADSESMNTFADMLSTTDRGLDTLPLTQTRRCPKAHVMFCKSMVNEFEAMPEAPEGSINSNNYENAIAAMNDGDMVICRVNAPLIKIAYALIRQGKKAVIRGRDIGKNLTSLIKKMKASDVSELISKLETYRQKETVKLLAKGPKANNQLISLNDRVDCIMELVDGIDRIEDLISKINKIFAEFGEDGKAVQGVMLSSVHRAKGLEALHVYIANPELMPHPMAKIQWQVKQEGNIKYVAFTRSKRDITTFTVPKDNK